MREILFRAKGQTSNKWHEGLLTRLDKDVCHIKDDRHTEWICDTSTVCQYTGLTDKNGRKIFEGDIIECKRNNQHFRSQIEWDCTCGGFMFQDTKEGSEVGLDSLLNGGIYNDFNLVGNIFDNSELVKGVGS